MYTFIFAINGDNSVKIEGIPMPAAKTNFPPNFIDKYPPNNCVATYP